MVFFGSPEFVFVVVLPLLIEVDIIAILWFCNLKSKFIKEIIRKRLLILHHVLLGDYILLLHFVLILFQLFFMGCLRIFFVLVISLLFFYLAHSKMICDIVLVEFDNFLDISLCVLLVLNDFLIVFILLFEFLLGLHILLLRLRLHFQEFSDGNHSLLLRCLVDQVGIQLFFFHLSVLEIEIWVIF